MKKLFLKSLFAAACCLVFPAGMSAQFSGSGSGTKDDPYRIFNADQLNQVRNFAGKTDVYFSLEADIDMTQWIAENNPSQGWLPIGNNNSGFCGKFNGNGHTISNLWINRPNTDYIGLFGYISTDVDIQNLKLENADYVGKDYVGGFVGYCNNANSITSCAFNGKISGNDYIGGICGYNFNDNYDMTISDCFTDSHIKGRDKIGGICGYNDDDNLHIEYRRSPVSDCISYNNIDGRDYIGGICGYNEVYEDDYFSFILLPSAFDCISYNNIDGRDYIGGIYGYVYSENGFITTSDCYSYNHINGNNYIGGIYGYSNIVYVSHITTSGCYSYNHINGNNCIGGIHGCSYTNYGNNGSYITISDCFTNGRIKGNESLGGIAGYLDNINGDGKYPIIISKCYSNNSIIEGKNYVGGIFGKLTANDAIYIQISKNVSLNEVIKSSGYSNLYRIGFRTGYNGGFDNNLAWVLTQMLIDGAKQPIPDDSGANGTSTGLSTLKLQATYEGLGWDFADMWQIEETESFPYFKNQTAPPYFQQALKKGDTNLSGQCAEAGTVSVCIGDKVYTVQSSGNTWSLTLDEPLQAGDVVDVWVQAEGKMPSYVVSQTISLAGGGTESDPFVISTPEDLQAISSDDTENAYYKLANDIDLTEWIETNSPTNGWIPVKLRGTFDGGGHTISGLWCDTVSNAGLFSKIIHGAVAKNIKITIPVGKAICGSSAGGIAGKNEGSITYCTVTGTVQNINNVSYYYRRYTGGIVGVNSATIGNCMFTGTVQGFFYVGGIAGINYGSIIKCYTSGDIIASENECYVGGIVGVHQFGSISDCYSTADVTSKYPDSYAGGITGITGDFYYEGVVERCYSDGAISGYAIAGICGYNTGAEAKVNGCVAANRSLSAYKSAMRVLGGYTSDASVPAASDNYAFEGIPVSVNNVPQKIDDDPLNGTTKTIDELYKKATYEALGWDMESIWDIDEGSSLPYLRVFDIPVSEISLDNTEITLDKRTTLQLIATVLPEFCRNNTLTWTSDNEKVATVDENGLITTVDEGTATITATANDGSGVSASCVVTVTFIDGIADIETSKVTVLAANGRITVSGKEQDDTVSVYDTGGRLLYQGESDVIDVPRKAMYIVTVSGKNYKVIVP